MPVRVRGGGAKAKRAMPKCLRVNLSGASLSGAILLPSSIQVTESISGSVVPLAMFKPKRYFNCLFQIVYTQEMFSKVYFVVWFQTYGALARGVARLDCSPGGDQDYFISNQTDRVFDLLCLNISHFKL